MTNRLRDDEEFIIRSVANAFSAEWRGGENPPDAYLKLRDQEVAVEISTLMQNRSDGRGGTRSRLSDDAPALQLVDEFNKELEGEIPHGCKVILTFRTPILKKRAIKPKLKEQFMILLRAGTFRRCKRIFWVTLSRSRLV
jgi:hypothetical protein